MPQTKVRVSNRSDRSVNLKRIAVGVDMNVMIYKLKYVNLLGHTGMDSWSYAKFIHRYNHFHIHRPVVVKLYPLQMERRVYRLNRSNGVLYSNSSWSVSFHVSKSRLPKAVQVRGQCSQYCDLLLSALFI